MYDERELKYLCEKCFHILDGTVKIKYENITKAKNQLSIDSTGSDGYLIGTCPCCGSKNQFFFGVDKDMARIVKVLNRIGYTTEYSCQGHSVPKFIQVRKGNELCITDLYPTPYINFKGNNSNMKLLSCLRKSGFRNILIDDKMYYNEPISKDIWKGKEKNITAYYLRSYVENTIIKTVRKFDGRKASKKVLKEYSKIMDQYFEDVCNKLADNLEEAYKDILDKIDNMYNQGVSTII